MGKSQSTHQQKHQKNGGLARPMDPPWILHSAPEPSIAAATPRQRRTVSNASSESWGNPWRNAGNFSWEKKLGKYGDSIDFMDQPLCI
jgi:hypothetical protein